MRKLVTVLLLLLPGIATAQPMRKVQDPAKTYAVPVDGFPSDGPADAKVTLVIAHDYADPYSEKNRATLDDLRKKYDKDLRIVFRNVVVHPRNAMAAALASCAAYKQKKFELMEDRLWEGFRQRKFDMDVDIGNGPQSCWTTPDGCANVVDFAKDIGLKIDKFKADMNACVSIVSTDQLEMQGKFGVNATPTFFINGRYLAGAMPTADFEKLIDEELAKATTQINKGTPRARYYKTFVLDKGTK